MKNLSKLEKCKEFWYLLFIICLFFFLRLPSLIEPHWYGDEGIYEVLGAGISQGRILYAEIWDNKPPLLYIFYALVGADQFNIRLLSLLTGIATILSFFSLSQKLFKRTFTTLIVTTVFAIIFGLPIIEGNIANAENFMLLPILLSFSLFVSFFTQKKISYLNSKKLGYLFSGFLLGFAFLIKTVALFDFATIIFIAIIATFNEQLSIKRFLPQFRKISQELLYLTLGFVSPLLISLLYFLSVGALTQYIDAIFLSTVGYVGFNNTFFIPQGLLISKVILLILFISILYVVRKKITFTYLFIFVWVGFSVFNSFFSHRPYTHYMIVLLPSLCLLLGLCLEELKRKRLIAIGSFILILFLVLNFFNRWSYTKTVMYYPNFALFVTNKKSLHDYQSFFDRRTPRDTEVALYVKNHLVKDAHVFYWGNSAQMYRLSNKLPPGRFTVAYHIKTNENTLKETYDDLLRVNPEYIIVLPDMGAFPYPMYNYVHKLTIQDIEIYERIY